MVDAVAVGPRNPHSLLHFDRWAVIGCDLHADRGRSHGQHNNYLSTGEQDNKNDRQEVNKCAFVGKYDAHTRFTMRFLQ